MNSHLVSAEDQGGTSVEFLLGSRCRLFAPFASFVCVYI